MYQKKQKPEEDIRKLFLIEFMKQLIIQYKIENNIRSDPVIQPLQTTSQKPQSRIQISRPPQIQLPKQQVQYISPVKTFPQRPIMLKTIESPQTPPVQIQYPKTNQTYAPQQPSSQTELSEYDLEKISPILLDPSVLSIECQGPGRPLLINKSGAIQVSSISLSQEEINSMISKISEKTRIPIISGTFKAAFLNFLATGVISNFVGTRFIIQKKNPFSPS